MCTKFSDAGLWDSKKLVMEPDSGYFILMPHVQDQLLVPGWFSGAAENTCNPLLHSNIPQPLSGKISIPDLIQFPNHFLQQCTCFHSLKSCWKVLFVTTRPIIQVLTAEEAHDLP